MIKIVMDLEFCNISKKKHPDKRKISKSEIIQIGAVKLNDSNEVIDEFDMLVRPEYATVSEEIKKLTHISNEMLSDKEIYNVVMDRFLEWIGNDTYEIYTWSMEDMRQIKAESELKEYHNEKLDMAFDHWVDLQKMFDQKLGVEQQISLTNALKAGNIVFEGVVHTACADAKNTARVYQIMDDESLFEKTYKTMLEMFRPTEELTFSLGNLFDGINLEELAIAG